MLRGPQAPLAVFQGCRTRVLFLFGKHAFFESQFRCIEKTIFALLPILNNPEYLRNASPYRKVIEIRPELSSRPAWFLK